MANTKILRSHRVSFIFPAFIFLIEPYFLLCVVLGFKEKGKVRLQNALVQNVLMLAKTCPQGKFVCVRDYSNLISLT